MDTEISVRKVIDGFGGLGKADEGRAIEYFLTSIGQHLNDYGYIFTPSDVQDYLDMMNAERDDHFSESYIDSFIRGLDKTLEADEALTADSLHTLFFDHKIPMSRQEI